MFKKADCLKSRDLDDFVCQNTISSKGVSADAIKKYFEKRRTIG